MLTAKSSQNRQTPTMWKQLLGQEDGRGELSQALTLGTTFAVGMAVFSFIGFKIDQKRGGGILFTLIGMIFGLAFGAYETWRVITFINRRAEHQSRQSPPPPHSDHSPDPEP